MSLRATVLGECPLAWAIHSTQPFSDLRVTQSKVTEAPSRPCDSRTYSRKHSSDILYESTVLYDSILTLGM